MYEDALDAREKVEVTKAMKAYSRRRKKREGTARKFELLRPIITRKMGGPESVRPHEPNPVVTSYDR